MGGGGRFYAHFTLQGSEEGAPLRVIEHLRELVHLTHKIWKVEGREVLEVSLCFKIKHYCTTNVPVHMGMGLSTSL